MSERERVDSYLEMIARLEPDIAHIDASAFYASAAISLKRIADTLDRAHPQTVEKERRENQRRADMLMISEVAFRYAEKGNNLEATLKYIRDVLEGKRA